MPRTALRKGLRFHGLFLRHEKWFTCPGAPGVISFNTVKRSRGSVSLIERDHALERRPRHLGPDRHKAPPAQATPTFNSARWHRTSPRRGRLVEWSDQRRGIRFHFRTHGFCRRCASDASYESVGNAGSIDVTTSDIPLRTDSVKRCKG